MFLKVVATSFLYWFKPWIIVGYQMEHFLSWLIHQLMFTASTSLP
jgi:hypothetical protein